MDIHVATRSLRDERDLLHTFHYFLVIDVVDTGRFCFEQYGVRITETSDNSTCIPSLTTSSLRIDQLMTTLVDNTVGPAGLQDVISDWI